MPFKASLSGLKLKTTPLVRNLKQTLRFSRDKWIFSILNRNKINPTLSMSRASVDYSRLARLFIRLFSKLLKVGLVYYQWHDHLFEVIRSQHK